MKKIANIFLLTIAVAFASCEKVLDIDEPANRQLVLNGVPAAGKRAFVNFAYTRFFLDPSNDHPVDGASLTLTVNGVPMLPDSVSHCNYFFPHTFAEDDSLSIDIFAGAHTIHAETYVPLYPAIDNFRVQHFESPSFNFMLATFNLADHADRAEYYNVVVQERDSGLRYNEWTASYDTVDTISSTYFLVPNNGAITSSDVRPFIPLGGYLYSRIMFLDRNIDGQNYPIELYIMQLVDTNELVDSVHTFKHEYLIDIESVTPARFRYMLSAASQNSMTSFFAEQGQAYSNVLVDGGTGLGIFAGSARRSYRFDADTIGSQPVPVGLPFDLQKLKKRP
jgi:hypothetical protein